MSNQNAALKIDASSIVDIMAHLQPLRDDAVQKAFHKVSQEISNAYAEVAAIMSELDSLNKRINLATNIVFSGKTSTLAPAVTKVSQIVAVSPTNKKVTRTPAPRPSGCDILTSEVRAMKVGDARSLTPEESKKASALRSRMKRSTYPDFKSRVFDIVENYGNSARPTKIIRLA